MVGQELIDQLTSLEVGVVGDVMLDQYVQGSADRLSPEAPVPVLRRRNESYFPGGAANVAMNLAQLGVSVRLFGVTGNDQEGETLRRLLKAASVDTSGLIVDEGRPTTSKVRLVTEAHNHIARIDRDHTDPLPSLHRTSLIDRVKAWLAENKAQGLIVSDYAKGVLDQDLLGATLPLARGQGLLVIVDPKRPPLSRYIGATVITPNRSEAEQLWGNSMRDLSSLERGSRVLLEESCAQALLVTLGGDGMALVPRDGAMRTIPVQRHEVFDVTGAGDTVVAIFTAAYLLTSSYERAANVANAAAGIVVAKFGPSSVTLAEFCKCLFGASAAKVHSRETIVKIVQELRQAGKSVVFTNGCFDLVHPGHVALLSKAKELGDVLVVGLNADDSARRLKGKDRPIMSLSERVDVVAGLESVDYVTPFHEDTPLQLIEALNPEVLVKGGDYRIDQIVGREVVEGNGGRVITMDLIPGVSTSAIISRIMEVAGREIGSRAD